MGIRRVIGMVVRQVLCESDTHPVQIGHGTLERVDSYNTALCVGVAMSKHFNDAGVEFEEANHE